ncbi:hypothetical protein HN014_05005 [Aquimarina sp. TRL1]|uniref:toxin-antitoxin system YwqK family antitoxin n=1 Tax=Aquimarina sp. (strain TRL1) TaxID=2736252 RepID=UPI00158F252A|nr:hypothetical protein [Aquimarina sp. TRL1]QKX04294.1 hypothetical protein HN014_05005 [Aquimarina sp. TRL1]
MILRIIIACLLSFTPLEKNLTVKKQYIKEYYESGMLKAEGWIMGATKTKYWIYYYPNGQIKKKGDYKNDKKNGYWYFYTKDRQLVKEGHFIDNKAEKWWIIYDIADNNSTIRITKKYQYQNNKKNGFCLIFKNDELFKAEKYINDQKMGEWTDVYSFRKDNPNAFL